MIRRILLAMLPAKPTTSLRRDVFVLSALSALLLLVHFLMGNGYGFHRDELQFLDDARHLQWGFVAYPPMTSFFGRLAIALFGISVRVLRLPAALVNAVSLVLVGLIARELGGKRAAQIVGPIECRDHDADQRRGHQLCPEKQPAGTRGPQRSAEPRVLIVLLRVAATPTSIYFCMLIALGPDRDGAIIVFLIRILSIVMG